MTDVPSIGIEHSFQCERGRLDNLDVDRGMTTTRKDFL